MHTAYTRLFVSCQNNQEYLVLLSRYTGLRMIDSDTQYSDHIPVVIASVTHAQAFPAIQKSGINIIVKLSVSSNQAKKNLEIEVI